VKGGDANGAAWQGEYFAVSRVCVGKKGEPNEAGKTGLHELREMIMSRISVRGTPSGTNDGEASGKPVRADRSRWNG